MHNLILPTFFLVSILHLTTAATVTITQSPVPSPTSSSYTDDNTFKDDILKAHNFYRAQHNASALVWNDTSAKFGSNWAGECGFVHSGGPTGENLAAGYANATASIDAWAQERLSYSWSSPGFSEKTGHFTQLVWNATTSVGCGRSSCQGNKGTPGWYVVCEYWPSGNVLVSGGSGGKNEEFVMNVGKVIKGKLSDTVESGLSTSAGRRVDVGRGWMDWRGGVALVAIWSLVGI